MDGQRDATPAPLGARGRTGSLRTKVGRGLAWSTANTVVSRVGQLVVGVALARLIVPEQFGVFAAALVVLNVVISISELGVSVAIVRARDQAEVDRIAPVVTSVSVLSGAVARCADGAERSVAGAGARRPRRRRPDPLSSPCRC